jgi:hypothetical protein
MTPLQTAVVLFPASLYGEGLRRAFLQLSPERPDKFTGWRGRLALLPIVAVAPVLVLALLAAGPVVSPLYLAGGNRLVLGVVIAFHVTFVLLWIAFLLLYRLVGAAGSGLALVLGGFASGSVVAGFLRGSAVPRHPGRLGAALRRPTVFGAVATLAVAVPHPRAGAGRLPARAPRRPMAPSQFLTCSSRLGRVGDGVGGLGPALAISTSGPCGVLLRPASPTQR